MVLKCGVIFGRVKFWWMNILLFHIYRVESTSDVSKRLVGKHYQLNVTQHTLYQNTGLCDHISEFWLLFIYFFLYFFFHNEMTKFSLKGAQSYLLNFWRFWYHKKAHIFLLTHVKFHGWKVLHLEVKKCLVMLTIIIKWSLHL